MAATWIGCAEAQSLSQEQRNALNHLGQVMAIGIECPEYEASQLNVSLLMAGYDLDFSKPAIERMMRDIVAQSREGLRATGTKIGCVVAWGLYGPGGQNVPNLIRRK